MPSEEHTLINRWTHHRDAEAFAEIINRYSGLVYGACRRILRNDAAAEDVTQECFIKLAQLDTPIRHSLGGWLHTVATRESLNRVKRDQRRTLREQRYADAQPDSQAIGWNDLQDFIDEAIAALPEKTRDPVLRQFVLGESHETIAKAIGLSRSAVTRRIQRGVENVRSQLSRRGIQVPAAYLTNALTAELPEHASTELVIALRKLGLSGGTSIARTPQPVSQGGILRSPWFYTALVAGIVALVAFSLSTPKPSSLLVARDGTVVHVPQVPDASLASDTAEPPMPTLMDSTESSDEGHNDPGKTGQEHQPSGPTETVTVTCVDPDGAPVPGVDVYLIHSERESGSFTFPAPSRDLIAHSAGPVHTDAQGRAEFNGFPQLSRARMGTRQVYARLPGQGVAFDSAHGMSEDPSDFELTMQPVTTLSGRVQMPEGFDPQTLTVELMTLMVTDIGRMPPVSSITPYNEGTSDRFPDVFKVNPNADGAFAINDVPTTANVYMRAYGPGLATTQRWGTLDDINPISFRLEPEAILEGVVYMGPSQRPAANALVEARMITERDQRGRLKKGTGTLLSFYTSTDAEGRYRFEQNLPEVPYVLLASADVDGDTWCAQPITDLRTQSGETVAVPPMNLVAGAEISGYIWRGKPGTPQPDALAVVTYISGDNDRDNNAAMAFSLTNAQGQYNFRLPPGTYEFGVMSFPLGLIYDHQYVPSVTIDAGRIFGNGPDITLVPAPEPPDPGRPDALIIGAVTDPDGNPLQRVPVYLNPHSRRTHVAGRTDYAGRFAIEAPSARSNEIVVGNFGFSTRKSDYFKTEPGVTYDCGTFTVRAFNGTISGDVVDVDGAPISGATVFAFSSRPRWQSGYRKTDNQTDAQGRFTLDAVPEDIGLRVSVVKNGYARETLADVRSGDSLGFTLLPEVPEP
jgi:RNA polymerase sigma factor (sigma-70 family)